MRTPFLNKNKKLSEKRDSSEIMALMISRQGAGRGKIQPLFAYDMNAAANDPRGEVAKKDFIFKKI